MLAERAGCAAEVAAVTEAAMRGELDFADVAARAGAAARRARRRAPWTTYAASCVLAAGARTFVRTLKRLDYQLAIVSGGFTQVTDPLVDRPRHRLLRREHPRGRRRPAHRRARRAGRRPGGQGRGARAVRRPGRRPGVADGRDRRRRQRPRHARPRRPRHRLQRQAGGAEAADAARQRALPRRDPVPARHLARGGRGGRRRGGPRRRHSRRPEPDRGQPRGDAGRQRSTQVGPRAASDSSTRRDRRPARSAAAEVAASAPASTAGSSVGVVPDDAPARGTLVARTSSHAPRAAPSRSSVVDPTVAHVRRRPAERPAASASQVCRARGGRGRPDAVDRPTRPAQPTPRLAASCARASVEAPLVVAALRRRSPPWRAGPARCSRRAASVHAGIIAASCSPPASLLRAMRGRSAVDARPVPAPSCPRRHPVRHRRRRGPRPAAGWCCASSSGWPAATAPGSRSWPPRRSLGPEILDELRQGVPRARGRARCSGCGRRPAPRPTTRSWPRRPSTASTRVFMTGGNQLKLAAGRRRHPVRRRGAGGVPAGRRGRRDVGRRQRRRASTWSPSATEANTPRQGISRPRRPGSGCCRAWSSTSTSTSATATAGCSPWSPAPRSLLGVGVDEDTAAVVRGGRVLEVVGAGCVFVVDGSALGHRRAESPSSAPRCWCRVRGAHAARRGAASTCVEPAARRRSTRSTWPTSSAPATSPEDEPDEPPASTASPDLGSWRPASTAGPNFWSYEPADPPGRRPRLAGGLPHRHRCPASSTALLDAAARPRAAHRARAAAAAASSSG